MASTPPPTSRRTHLVPTHVRTPETLITLAGVSLSIRQFLLILVGIALSYRVWLLFAVLSLIPAGQVLRWVLTTIPCCIALAFAFVSLAARPLDVWFVVMLRYALRPHRFVWRSVRFFDPGLSGISKEEESDGEAVHDATPA
jgi:hypothetical protein